VAVVWEGDGDTARQLLEMHFDHIFFTGGGRVGRLVMAAAARHLTRSRWNWVARARRWCSAMPIWP